MSEAARRRSGARIGWTAVLAACTLWLVIQNSVLVGLALAAQPSTVALLATALFKAAALVIARFWASPAAIALGAGLVTALAMLGRPAPRTPSEVRHV